MDKRGARGGMSSEPHAEGYRTITTFRTPFFASSLSNLFAFRLLSKLAVPKSTPITPNPIAIGQEGPNSGTRPYIQGWELLFCPRGAPSTQQHPPPLYKLENKSRYHHKYDNFIKIYI